MSTATAARPAPSSTKGRRGGRALPILLMLAGILLVLYPVLATQYNNLRHHEFSQKYSNDMQDLSEPERAAQLAAARAYNSGLADVSILDPWTWDDAQDPESETYKEYLSQLSESDVMARLKVPSVEIDLPVFHGTSDDTLNEGVGHLYGTSLPVGGQGTHAVLTTHSGMPDATLFDHLDDVVLGDLILVEVSGETLAYRVDQIKIVEPQEIGELRTVPGHDYLTLFTCSPYTVNTHRLLVRGERVPYTPEIADIAEKEISPFKLEPWMLATLAGAAVGAVKLYQAVRNERRQRAKANVAAASPAA